MHPNQEDIVLLARLLKQFDLAEIHWRFSDHEIRLRAKESPQQTTANEVVVPTSEISSQTPVDDKMVTVELSEPFVFRWNDGDWVTQTTVTVKNLAKEPIEVHRNLFDLTGQVQWLPWSAATEFPPTTLAQNQSMTAQIAWYTNGTQPRPEQGNFAFRINKHPVWSTQCTLRHGTDRVQFDAE